MREGTGFVHGRSGSHQKERVDYRIRLDFKGWDGALVSMRAGIPTDSKTGAAKQFGMPKMSKQKSSSQVLVGLSVVSQCADGKKGFCLAGHLAGHFRPAQGRRVGACASCQSPR